MPSPVGGSHARGRNATSRGSDLVRLGLITDVHEDVSRLRWALSRLQTERLDRVLCLGDVCEDGSRIEETCAMLSQARVECIWGNHDIGLCTGDPAFLRARFDPAVVDFMHAHMPSLTLEDCYFAHIEPALDPRAFDDLWLEPEGAGTEQWARRNLEARPARLAFMGHLHRWILAVDGIPVDWDGDTYIVPPESRALVTLGALCNGWCATFDTDAGVLQRIRQPSEER
jgi:predicted phosphodiesterase